MNKNKLSPNYLKEINMPKSCNQCGYDCDIVLSSINPELYLVVCKRYQCANYGIVQISQEQMAILDNDCRENEK